MKLSFSLQGQIPSGKNAVVVTRTGKRFPSKRFKTWREEATSQICMQLGMDREPAQHKPLTMRVVYTPGDLRTRDVSGMLDALFHLVTHCGLIVDDGQIRHVIWEERALDRQQPGVCVTLTP